MSKANSFSRSSASSPRAGLFDAKPVLAQPFGDHLAKRRFVVDEEEVLSAFRPFDGDGILTQTDRFGVGQPSAVPNRVREPTRPNGLDRTQPLKVLDACRYVLRTSMEPVGSAAGGSDRGTTHDDAGPQDSFDSPRVRTRRRQPADDLQLDCRRQGPVRADRRRFRPHLRGHALARARGTARSQRRVEPSGCSRGA